MVSNPLVASLGGAEWLILAAAVAALLLAFALISSALIYVAQHIVGGSKREPDTRFWFASPMIPALVLGTALGLVTGKIWVCTLSSVAIYFVIEAWHHLRQSQPSGKPRA